MTTMNAGWSASREEAESRLSSSWWMFLATGIAWFIFSFVVLSFTYTTVWAVAVFFGISLLFVGMSEYLIAGIVPGWKWAHALLGTAAVVAGIMALAWPSETFVVAATLIGWYLLVRGVADLIVSLMSREEDDLWWMRLAAGVGEIAVGLWAIGYQGRSMMLLAIWVGVAALFKGFSDTALAFRLKSL